MERLIFDTHAHYVSRAFNKYRDTLLAELPARGVALVLDCGTDYATSKASLALAERYDYIYAAAGIHPESLIEDDASTVAEFKGDWRAEMAAIRPLYEHPKVLAVGEVGLDHHWPVPKDTQLEMFEAHIRLALELDLPLSIHDREAHAEIYALLKKYKPKGVLHAFSGSPEDAKWLCAQGLYIGLGGPVTFKNARRPQEVAAMVPPEKLLVETDCPYMAPEPYRGKKSDSAMIAHTAAKIAELRGCAAEDVLKMTLENGKRLFGIAG
ncbi:TatD family hydrolase [Ruminococcaceae bacterium OttesenSCG-928-D13]|nr:TatD family hydrolase [Ruminococcaceae bacterium OttesenSCG-928-D13]